MGYYFLPGNFRICSNCEAIVISSTIFSPLFQLENYNTTRQWHTSKQMSQGPRPLDSQFHVLTTAQHSETFDLATGKTVVYRGDGGRLATLLDLKLSNSLIFVSH